jgi:DNA adenine methylase
MGGKYRLRTELAALASTVEFSRLVDPFVGGGSTLSMFGSVPFLASDANTELVNFHQVCRDHPDSLVDAIHSWIDSRDQFMSVRSSRPVTDVDRALRFLYLNRTAYAGMYRVNRSGVYNVPYGGGGRLVANSLIKSVRAHAQVMSTGEIRAEDFTSALNRVQPGDLVFLDPPYSATGHETFDRYGENPYRDTQRGQLSNLANNLARSGIATIATLPASAELLAGFARWRLLRVTYSRTMPNGEVIVAAGPKAWKAIGRPVPRSHADLVALLDRTN